MRIYFIRHAIAEDREQFALEDHLRPLSEAGRAKAKKLFRIYRQLLPDLSRIYTSEATRAKQTAQLLSEAFKGAAITTAKELNPGADYDDFKRLLKQMDFTEGRSVAVVGHEPDFSTILGEVLCSGVLYLEVKKASLIEVEIGLDGRGILKNLLSPKLALQLKKG